MNHFKLNPVRLPGIAPGIWNLVIDTPGQKVNTLGQGVLSEFSELLDTVESYQKSGELEILVLSSEKKQQFIAGADIKLIQSVKNEEEAQGLSATGQSFLNRWEDLPFPTIAAIEGPALGGGFEWALASDYIVLSNHPSTKIGLPEVMLGLIPGMGGCVRMPRRTGIAQALDLLLTGKQLNADRALKTGLADAVIPYQNFHKGVFQWIERNRPQILSGKRFVKKPKLGGMGGVLGTLLEKTPVGRLVIYSQAKKGVLSKTKGHYPAPLEIIEVLKKTGAQYGAKLRGEARAKAMKIEAASFGKMAATSVSKALIRLFFLMEENKKADGLGGAIEGPGRTFERVGVLGAGVMGGGIAHLLADQSVTAVLKDIQLSALNVGSHAAQALFLKSLKQKRIGQRKYDQKINRISPQLSYDAFSSVELVIEAIVENLDIKRKVFLELENYVSERCVIASNTSSLSITAMQKGMKYPKRFVGMHFFNPVHKMPLVEVIRGEESSEEAVKAVVALAKQLGKIPVVVKDAPGFLVNRLLAPYLNEAFYLLKDGATVQEIDQAILEFGMPMGPLELLDEIGLDVGIKVSHILSSAFGSRMKAPPFGEKFSDLKRLGKKTNKGIYEYKSGGKKRIFNEALYSELGLLPKPGSVPKNRIVDRCILLMVNEAARCLSESVVPSPDAVDLAMIMGTGFPPFRGGLLRYADTEGLQRIVERLEQLQQDFGDRFEPSDALKKFALKGSFYDRD
jgi:3-hydroxyacyl-CoA dehydrogenase/enoyl-CoA hydratase/3-hydroxybutyryl-CoA epimerase